MSADELVPLLLAGIVVISLLGQALLYVSASIALRRLRRQGRYRLWRRTVRSRLAPRVSVLMPAYGEEASIVDSVEGILALSYPDLEVVVVNDGSRDATLDRIVTRFEMAPVHALFRHEVPCAEVLRVYRSPREPRLVVVDKRNGGKADALNCGLNVAGGELVCAIDADTLVAHDALQHLVAPFMEDSAIVATGGTVRLVNDAAVRGGQVVKARVPSHILAGAQAVEYVRAFLVGRLGWNLLGGNLLISGAFGVFRRSSLLTIGGYEHASVGEDLELVVRLRRRAYEAGVPAKVVFSPDPVAWTEAPESLRTLARQRNRWFRGLCDVLLRHRRMILNPRYGTAGMIAMPYYLVVEGLAPVLEATGLLLLGAGLAGGWVDPAAVQITLAAYLFSAAVGTAVLVFDDIAFGSYRGVRSRLRLVWLTVFEQLVFRPMTVAWRLWGLKHFFEGRSEWGAQVRRGFSA